MTKKTDKKDKPGKSLDAFYWYKKSMEDFPHTRTLDRVISLASGVAVALEIIEADDLNEMDAGCFGSVLDANQKGALLRLAIEAAHIMSEECTESLDHADEYGVAHLRRFIAREDELEAAKGIR